MKTGLPRVNSLAWNSSSKMGVFRRTASPDLELLGMDCPADCSEVDKKIENNSITSFSLCMENWRDEYTIKNSEILTFCLYQDCSY